MIEKVPWRERVIDVIKKDKGVCVLIFVHLQSAYFTVSISSIINLLQFIMIIGDKCNDKENGPKNDTWDGATYISGTSFVV